MKFIAIGPISTNLVLVQIMAWRRSADKPMSEPVMVNLLTIYASHDETSPARISH